MYLKGGRPIDNQSALNMADAVIDRLEAKGGGAGWVRQQREGAKRSAHDIVNSQEHKRKKVSADDIAWFKAYPNDPNWEANLKGLADKLNVPITTARQIVKHY